MENPPPPPLSPRAGILAGLAPEYLATGWEKRSRRWVTAAEVNRPGRDGPGPANGSIDSLPGLDGALLTGDRPGAASAGDYGGMVLKQPSAVLRPGSPADVARFVGFAAERGIPVAPRGQGHTLWGQSQVEEGVRIDLRMLNGVGPVTGRTLEAEAGATWRSVLQVALTHGLTPPVLTDYLSLTVGGTLSVGGVSGTSWRYGTQGDNVEALTVVTGEGETVRCSESENIDLFEAVLAGQGQCGIITSARLRLVPAPQSVRVFVLPYADLHSVMQDQRLVVGDGRFDAAVVFIVPGPGGWMYLLEALKWLEGEGGPDDAALLHGLGFLAGAEQVYDQPYPTYADRVQAQIGDLDAVGLASFPPPVDRRLRRGIGGRAAGAGHTGHPHPCRPGPLLSDPALRLPA